MFLLSKGPRYFYDKEAIKPPSTTGDARRPYTSQGAKALDGRPEWRSGEDRDGDDFSTRERRTSDWYRESLDDAIETAWDDFDHLTRVRASGGTLVGDDGLPLAMDVNVAAFKGAHFATMPPRLVEPCIKAGTSEKGCCPACGSPRVRDVARRRVATRPGTNSKVNRASGDEASPDHDHSSIVVGNRDPQRHTTTTRTVGWSPSCTCPEAAPVPCVVLDPFGGALTTLVVARSLGRRGVATELSDEYIAIGRRRLDRPHAPAAGTTPVGVAGQRSLFDAEEADG